MNVIQKSKSKLAKVYLKKEDTLEQTSKLAKSLVDFLSLVPLDYSLQLHLSDITDITMEFTGILMSLIKTANDKKIAITLMLRPNLADLILDISTGSLEYSVELIKETT